MLHFQHAAHLFGSSTLAPFYCYHRPTAKTSKGCGTVQFKDKAAAAAALEALHGSRSLPRAEGALVVERMDPRKQKQNRLQAYGEPAWVYVIVHQYYKLWHQMSVLKVLPAQ
jgi:hypothetical protein